MRCRGAPIPSCLARPRFFADQPTHARRAETADDVPPLDDPIGLLSHPFVTIAPAHAHLRQETRALHDATERSFAVFDLATREGYIAFLRAQAVALGVAERWLDDQDMTALVADWPARRRMPLLMHDLARLHAASPDMQAALPRPEGHPLGWLYVLEGSRFGGRVLARQVKAGGDPVTAAATTYLDQPAPASAWQELMACIERESLRPGQRDAIVTGARAAFALFGACAARAATAYAASSAEDPNETRG